MLRAGEAGQEQPEEQLRSIVRDLLPSFLLKTTLSDVPCNNVHDVGAAEPQRLTAGSFPGENRMVNRGAAIEPQLDGACHPSPAG